MPFHASKRLLIGVSSPVGYFYARASEKGRPAPILESPLSYCLLYDEIWFFSRSICPYNMEGLSFVHFVDEELQPAGLPKDAVPRDQSGPIGPFPWDTWNGVIDATIGRRWNYDNHSTPLPFGEMTLLPTPGRHENLWVDRFVAAQYGMDLVENTANAIWSREFDERNLQLAVSEQLLSARVASLQTLDGPWHPMMEDLRGDSLLKAYRQRLGDIAQAGDLAQVDARVQHLSDEFERVVARIVAEHFDISSLTISTASYLLGLIPTVGPVAGLGALAKEIVGKLQARNKDGWVGFLGKARTELKKTSSERDTDGRAA